MNKNAKKAVWILGGAGLLIGTAAAVSYGATKAFMSVALNKETPKAINTMKKFMSGSEQWTSSIIQMQKEASAKLEAGEYETVETTAFDGIKLVGHYKKTDNAKRTVICFHGWRSSWSMDYGIISEFIESNGCNVLYVEQRGQNDSEGDYMGFGLLERYDCLSWAEYVVSLGDGLPIYLSGISMGAATVMMASGLDLPDQVHGITADCGFTSPDAILKHVCRSNLHLPYTGLRRRIVSDICRRKLNSQDSRYSSADALKKSKTPVLFIHGTADNFVPVWMTYENYLACAAPKRLLIVPGADHGLSYLVEPENYKKAIIDFWNDFDR